MPPETLVANFGTQFAIRRPHHLTFIVLVNIRQEKGESLGPFMERLKKVSLYICNLNQEEALHHMVMTLRLGPFVDNICKKLVEELDEL